MKNSILFILILAITVACNKEAPKKTPQTPQVPFNEQPTPPDPRKSGSNGLTVVGGTHYICPSKHEEGNADAAGTCPKCNLALVHNQGYHQSQNTTPTAPTTPTNNTSPVNTGSPSNANGVFHYVCENGCAGGAASSGSCSNCGAALKHNQAYHT